MLILFYMKCPVFFEGQLPDFNFGTVDGASCTNTLTNSLASLDLSPYSSVINGRFKGGYITRGYGAPHKNIHAVQLELSQHTYMDEPSDHYNQIKATQVKCKLKAFVQCLVDYAQQS